MNRSKLSLRRSLAVLGAAVLGLTAAVAIASPASAHTPFVKGSAECVADKWEVTWTVTSDQEDITGTVTAVEPAPVEGITVGATVPKSVDGALTGKQVVPASETSVTLKVTVKWVRKDYVKEESAEDKVELTGPCPKPTETPTPTPTTSPPPVPGEPEGSVTSTCDELIFEIVNPEDGETVTVTFTPSTGTPQTLEVSPGETETATFPASEGLTVVASSEGVEDEPFAWVQPDDCEEGGGGGDLPVTGAAAGGIAAGALVLLALGVALFLVARRRRTTFTA